METPDDQEVIFIIIIIMYLLMKPSKVPTVATRPIVHLCDPTSVTHPMHSTPLEPPSSHETPARFGTQYVSPVSGHSPGPPVLSPQLPFTHTNRTEIYTC